MENNFQQTDQKNVILNKMLRLSATITLIFGFFSVLALILLCLALSDIAHGEENLKLEWYSAGISIIILSAFTVSTFITLGFLMKVQKLWK